MSSAIETNRRFVFPPRAMTVFSVLAVITFTASSSAPTPLYHLYQTSLGLSPLLVTVIFASYAFSLLAALLTVGSLSDYVGRRPVIFTALALNAVAMLVFMTAGNAATLIAARVIQGFAAGAAATTLGAAILDTDRKRGPVLNSISAFLGLTVGSLGAGALVTFAPLPTELTYAVLFGISVLEIGVLALMPETTAGRPGALASLKPHVSVPPQARAALIRVTPINVAAWALGGFYFSLMPTLVTIATGITLPLVGSAVVAALVFSAVFSVLAFQNTAAPRILAIASALLALGIAITLGGVHLQAVALMLAGTVVAGIGFGGAFAGNLRTLLPLAGAEERAGLLATFYVESYLAFSLPAIGAGLLAPALGLAMTAYLYGALLIVLTAISFAATCAARTAN